jgi:hypothetical protein
MIAASLMSSAVAAGLTLDRLFRYAAAQRPDDVALIDPPNRAGFTTGAPRSLTYGEAERAVAAIAARLPGLGLQAGDAVGLQLPNTVENVLALLGVMRAGLVAAPLPLLWRRAECGAALEMIGATALIATTRIGATDYGALAMAAAADAFTVRQVCMFGGCPDGVVALDDVIDAAASDASPAAQPDSASAAGAQAAMVTALVTWDIEAGSGRPVAVARSHAELMAASFEVMLETRPAMRSVMLSSLGLGSLAGLATTLAPWLLSRGTLVLHHAFDAAVMRHQILDHRCNVVLLPGSLTARCAAAGMFRDSAVGKVVAVWRAPERLSAAPLWTGTAPTLTDVSVFGETGLIAALRGPDGRPAGLRPGAQPRARQDAEAPILVEAACTPGGTLALRGPMVPRSGEAPVGVEAPDGGFVDTGYPCRIPPGAETIVIIGLPAGLVAVGGYRVALAKIQEAVRGIDPAARIAAFPDSLTGQRLAGSAAHPHELHAALAASDLNPLAADAFRPSGDAETRNVESRSAA